MVAHPGLDVRILALTCAVADAVRGLWQRPQRHGRPAGTGCGRLLAAVCVKYRAKVSSRYVDREMGTSTTWTSLVILPLLLQLPQVVMHAAVGAARGNLEDLEAPPALFATRSATQFDLENGSLRAQMPQNRFY